jgi:hypothetical protein
MHVSEIRVNRILVNQGLGVLSGEDDMQNVFSLLFRILNKTIEKVTKVSFFHQCSDQ